MLFNGRSEGGAETNWCLTRIQNEDIHEKQPFEDGRIHNRGSYEGNMAYMVYMVFYSVQELHLDEVVVDLEEALEEAESAIYSMQSKSY